MSAIVLGGSWVGRLLHLVGTVTIRARAADTTESVAASRLTATYLDERLRRDIGLPPSATGVEPAPWPPIWL